MQKKHKKRILITMLTTAVLVAAWTYIYHPPGGSGLVREIEAEALTANVLLLRETTYITEGDATMGSSVGTAYGSGASGTIIKHEDDRYYVLTAYHVIKPEKDADRTEILIVDCDETEKLEPGMFQKYQGFEGFYGRFPKARVEFYDTASDLALISFTSEETYATIQIAESLPKFGDVVGTLSNPADNPRNTVTDGRLLSLRSTAASMKFYGVVHPMLTHTSHTAPGSSGSMVLNEELQLIGVTLGGTEIKLFAFQLFLAGKAMPCDRILDFLSENDFKI